MCHCHFLLRVHDVSVNDMANVDVGHPCEVGFAKEGLHCKVTS